MKDKTRPAAAVSSGGLQDTLVRWDKSISHFIHSSASALEQYGLRTLCLLLEYSGHGVPWLLGAALLLLLRPLHVTLAVNLLLALVVDLIMVGLIKVLVRRQRPKYNIDDMRLSVAVDRFSFPSGHSSRVATVAPLLLSVLGAGAPLALLLIAWAAIVPLSRVMMGRHYVLDVLGGIVLGLLQFTAVALVLWVPLPLCIFIREVLLRVPRHFWGTT